MNELMEKEKRIMDFERKIEDLKKENKDFENSFNCFLKEYSSTEKRFTRFKPVFKIIDNLLEKHFKKFGFELV